VKRGELEHILRAAATIARDEDIRVVGSQAILGSFGEDELPEAAHASIEVDVTFYDDPHNDKSDAVDMHIGEGSAFHELHGYYAQGVDISVAHLPNGWKDRVKVYTGGGANGARAHCLDPHDLVISKLVAGRDKDFEFAHALLAQGLVSAQILIERAAQLPDAPEGERVKAWVTGWVKKHQPTSS
jgi:hypothetical protein